MEGALDGTGERTDWIQHGIGYPARREEWRRAKGGKELPNDVYRISFSPTHKKKKKKNTVHRSLRGRTVQCRKGTCELERVKVGGGERIG